MVRLKVARVSSTSASGISISIPYGSIKRILVVIVSIQYFQFQFLMVRLKVSAGQAAAIVRNIFQFLMVRLKVPE